MLAVLEEQGEASERKMVEAGVRDVTGPDRGGP